MAMKHKRPVAGKVVVVNFSGNVGKTTICAQVLTPRMPGAKVYAVETINAAASDDAKNAELINGKEYGSLSEQMLLTDSAIVDVGASNVEQFMQAMCKFEGSHDDFDCFLVPATPEKKQQADTANTIKALSAMGVPPEKIVVIFNRVDFNDGESLQSLFPAIYALHSQGLFTLYPAATIYANEVYDRIRSLKRTVTDLATDPTDYRQKLRETLDSDTRATLVELVTAQRLAKSANKNLDTVFNAIFTQHG